VSGEQFIRSGIDNDAVIAGRSFDNDETDSSGRAVRLFYVSDIDAFFAVEAQCHFPEGIIPNSGDEVDFRTEPGAAYGLVGSFAAVVDAIARPKKRLAGARQALYFHGQTGRVAANDSDSRHGHKEISEDECR
jgi:hypothetical protein